MNIFLGFPGGLVVKNLPANVGDTGLIPGLGRSMEKEIETYSSYSCLGNPIDRGDWQGTVHGVTKESDTIQGLNNQWQIHAYWDL